MMMMRDNNNIFFTVIMLIIHVNNFERIACFQERWMMAISIDLSTKFLKHFNENFYCKYFNLKILKFDEIVYKDIKKHKEDFLSSRELII